MTVRSRVELRSFQALGTENLQTPLTLTDRNLVNSSFFGLFRPMGAHPKRPMAKLARVNRIWKRWVQDGNTERLAGSQRPPIAIS
ncbi:hypothetical protein TNCV_3689831 [Trichonephila clavipes]|uniref:Uncharacterized protein n=1 Tax=Trichonephila clavipes TaxID=2585209 RepID=A0A8X6VQW7_TRICX|nr:hypothetical protein TNCV_3689831 [Trichonephila clavipes]